jgi:NADH:ubiquinone oxidoreductase subunit E
MEPPSISSTACRRFIKTFPEKIDEYSNLLTGNPIFMNRLRASAISPPRTPSLSASPAHRCAPQRRRLRPAPRHALLELREVRVQGAGLQRCDVWARYLVRLEEMRESVKIIQQALDGMPEGPVKADAPKIVLPDREKMKTQMESLIHHFKIVTEGFAVPPAKSTRASNPRAARWATTSSPTAPRKPYRVHMRNPSFASLQALETMCQGCACWPTSTSRSSVRSTLCWGRSTDESCRNMSIFSPKLAARFDALVQKYPLKRSALIPMLLYAQDEIGYLSDAVIDEVADRIGITPLEVRNVPATTPCCASSRPASTTSRSAPTSAACCAAATISSTTLQEALGIGHKGVTPDGLFSLEEVECIGVCCWAPAMQVNYDFHDELRHLRTRSTQILEATDAKAGGLRPMPRLVSHPDEVKIVTRRFGMGAAEIDRYIELGGYNPSRNAWKRGPNSSSTR